MTNQVRRGGSRHAPIRMGGRLPAGGRLRGQPRADRRRGHLVERRGTGRGRHVGLRRQAGCAPGPAGRRAHGLPRPGRGRGHGLAPVRAAGRRSQRSALPRLVVPAGSGPERQPPGCRPRQRAGGPAAGHPRGPVLQRGLGRPGAPAPADRQPAGRPGGAAGRRPGGRRAARDRRPAAVGCGSAHPHRPGLGLVRRGPLGCGAGRRRARAGPCARRARAAAGARSAAGQRGARPRGPGRRRHHAAGALPHAHLHLRGLPLPGIVLRRQLDPRAGLPAAGGSPHGPARPG